MDDKESFRMKLPNRTTGTEYPIPFHGPEIKILTIIVEFDPARVLATTTLSGVEK